MIGLEQEQLVALDLDEQLGQFARQLALGLALAIQCQLDRVQQDDERRETLLPVYDLDDVELVGPESLPGAP